MATETEGAWAWLEIIRECIDPFTARRRHWMYQRARESGVPHDEALYGAQECEVERLPHVVHSEAMVDG